MSESIPNVPVTRETFRVAFPPGAKIFDHIAGVAYRVGEVSNADVLQLTQAGVREADANRFVGVIETTKAEDIGAPVVSLPTGAGPAVRGTAPAQAALDSGPRRMLLIALAGSGGVLLLMGVCGF